MNEKYYYENLLQSVLEKIRIIIFNFISGLRRAETSAFSLCLPLVHLITKHVPLFTNILAKKIQNYLLLKRALAFF